VYLPDSLKRFSSYICIACRRVDLVDYLDLINLLYARVSTITAIAFFLRLNPDRHNADPQNPDRTVGRGEGRGVHCVHCGKGDPSRNERNVM